MTLSINIGNFFNDSSSHALVDELRKRTSKEIRSCKTKKRRKKKKSCRNE